MLPAGWGGRLENLRLDVPSTTRAVGSEGDYSFTIVVGLGYDDAGGAMTRAIRARARRGTFEPLGTCCGCRRHRGNGGIPDGPTEEDIAVRRLVGGWRGLVDAEKLIADIYASRLIGARPDRER